MTANVLRYRSAWLAGGWMLVALVIYLSVGRVHAAPDIENGDKVGHLLAYSALAFWFLQIFTRPAQRFGIAIALVAMGVTLEFVQSMLPYRDFDVFDMAANTAGVLIGSALALSRPDVFQLVESLLPRR